MENTNKKYSLTSEQTEDFHSDRYVEIIKKLIEKECSTITFINNKDSLKVSDSSIHGNFHCNYEKISKFKDENHLIIFAGENGDLMYNVKVESLSIQHKDSRSDRIICVKCGKNEGKGKTKQCDACLMDGIV